MYYDFSLPAAQPSIQHTPGCILPIVLDKISTTTSIRTSSDAATPIPVARRDKNKHHPGRWLKKPEQWAFLKERIPEFVRAQEAKTVSSFIETTLEEWLHEGWSFLEIGYHPPAKTPKNENLFDKILRNHVRLVSILASVMF